MTAHQRFAVACLASAFLAFQVGCGCSEPAPPQPKNLNAPAVVLFELDGQIPQFPGGSGFLSPMATSQHKLEKLVNQAMSDILVTEFVFHFGSPEVGWARAGEISDLISTAAASGKPTTCHLEAPDNRTYWMAARACPKIVVAPAGSVDLVGLSLEAVFMKELLDSLGVTADMLSMGRYKDAAESLTRTDMSPDSRVAAEALLTDLNRAFIAGISKGRKLDTEQVTTLIDGGPYSAQRAKAAKLVDEVETIGSLLDKVRDKYPGGVVSDYGKIPPKPLSFTEILTMFGGPPPEQVDTTPKIALISASGPVMSGGGQDDLLGGMEVISDADLVETLSKATRDDSVKAVVLRIDSPGGSALASDNIWQAVSKLSATKPVVASMGDVAASGGYYIASAANEIFASESTLTGSIGVVGGKMVLGAGLEKVGIRSETIKKGQRSGISSPFHPFDENERAAITALMQETYDLFISRVVKGRGLEREKVLAVAEGRVWTGSQAHKAGLIDNIGTLVDAITRARELAKMPNAPLEIYPKPKNFIEILTEQLAGQETSVLLAAKRFPAGRRALALTSCLMESRVLAFSPVVFDVR